MAEEFNYENYFVINKDVKSKPGTVSIGLSEVLATDTSDIFYNLCIRLVALTNDLAAKAEARIIDPDKEMRKEQIEKSMTELASKLNIEFKPTDFIDAYNQARIKA